MPTIRQRGPKKFQAQVRIKQHGVIVFAESATFETESQAKKWAYALEAKIEKHGIEAHYTQSTTVSDLIGNWLKHKEEIKPLSRGMQHSTRSLLMSPFANTSLSNLKAKVMVDWAMELKSRLDPATVLHHFMVLRSVFTTAEAVSGVRADMTQLDAAMDALKRTRVIAKSKSRDQRVTDADITRIVEYLGGQDLLVRTDHYVRLAVALPRRREELLTMRWSDYDGGTIRLRDTKHPTDPRDEIVPVPPSAKAIIDSLPRYDGEDRIMPYKPESVSTAFRRAVCKLGLAHIRLHDLRHEGISRLFEAGLSIQEVSLVSGHVSWSALKRYTHIKPSHVVEKLTNAHLSKTQKATAQPA